ncbi:MAG: SDR family oxidoreductase [Pseudonocardia sp.]|nr:SDR family oxidoreductase [Pseudonocardia sp.]
MDLALTGRTAIVTGAGRGIGLAVAKALTDEGVRVVGAARTVTPELEKASVAAVSADLATADGATALVAAALGELGGGGRRGNNVGGGAPHGVGGFLDAGGRQWHDILARNLFSAVWTTRAALPSLLERRGAIVTISSVNARVPATGPVGYSEAKAALTAFSKRLSEEFGPQGLRVNTVSPGVTGSPLWRAPDGFGAAMAAAHGMGLGEFLDVLPAQAGITSGRITEPEEVAALVTFLVSGVAANMIGSDVVIDGGMIKTS